MLKIYQLGHFRMFMWLFYGFFETNDNIFAYY